MRWWDRLIVWGGFALGVYLLISGDTVERLLGVGLIAVPLLMYGYGVWKVLQERRTSR
jgi:hypothetical protein